MNPKPRSLTSFLTVPVAMASAPLRTSVRNPLRVPPPTHHDDLRTSFNPRGPGARPPPRAGASPAVPSGRLCADEQGLQLFPLPPLLPQQSAREPLEDAPLFREEGADRHVRLDHEAGGLGVDETRRVLT